MILHIADLCPEAGLIGPLGSYSRALQYQWCFFGMTEIESALMDIARQLWKEGDPIERAEEHLQKARLDVESKKNLPPEIRNSLLEEIHRATVVLKHVPSPDP